MGEQAQTAPGAGSAAAQRRSRGPVALTWERFRRKKLAMACLILVAVLYLAGAFAPLLSTHPYSQTDLAQTQKAPSTEHWFGTDRLGRDIYSRTLYGMQTTVILTVISVLSGSILLGVTLGLVSGYFRGWTDALLQRVGEVTAAFPSTLLIILLAATLRPRFLDMARAVEDSTGITGIVRSGVVDFVILTVVFLPLSWFGMMRLVRGQVLALRESEYVQAARAIGASTWRILFAHIMPNVLGPIIVSVSFSLGTIAGSEIFLSFLGLGVQPPRPSLGGMMSELPLRGGSGFVSILRDHPEQLLFPGMAIFLFLFCWALIGDALTDVFNPRSR
jgi:ABC-type dipeptide/oligopeptide/nickel transport system permease subunit